MLSMLGHYQVEEHEVDGKVKRLLVHRKGATRAFPPHHPMVPKAYQETGQPVIIGGTMGTCSYVLTGTEVRLSGPWLKFESGCAERRCIQFSVNFGILLLSQTTAVVLEF